MAAFAQVPISTKLDAFEVSYFILHIILLLSLFLPLFSPPLPQPHKQFGNSTYWAKS